MNSCYACEEARNPFPEQLVSMYNDAVEMIWFLESRVRQLSEENDSVWESYEELSRQHFG